MRPLRCPCGETILIPPGATGDTVQCAGCGALLSKTEIAPDGTAAVIPRAEPLPPPRPPDKRERLPRISTTALCLFAGEVFFTLAAGSWGVSRAVDGDAFWLVFSLTAVFAVSALFSYPVTVGRGLLTSAKRAMSGLLAVSALGIAAFSLVGAAGQGQDFAVEQRKIEREIETIEDQNLFEEFPDPQQHAQVSSLQRRALEQSLDDLDDARKKILVDTGIVLAGAVALLIMNLLWFMETGSMKRG